MVQNINYEKKYLKYKKKYNLITKGSLNDNHKDNKIILKKINDAIKKVSDADIWSIDHDKYNTTYGELLHSELDKIFTPIIDEKDVFVDLGSGRGILLFYMILRYGIKSMGIEIIDIRHNVANKLKDLLLLKKSDQNLIKLINGDFFKADLSEGTIFYCDNTMYDEELENKLINYIINQKRNSNNPIKFLIFKKELGNFSNKLTYHSSIKTKTTYDKNTKIHLYNVNI